MNSSRAFEYLRREIVKRKLPHGLVHWRYFLPGQSQTIRIHRKLWLRSIPKLPRPLWLCIEAALWLRWVLWGAWRQSFICVSRWGKAVNEEEGIPVLHQTIVALRLSIGYCLKPFWIYQFHLYRDPRRVWEYVYDHEIQAFHRLRGRKLGEKKESLELLQDKFDLSEKLREMRLPVAQILALVPKGERFEFSKWPNQKLFCKTRRGSRAEGAFVVEKEGEFFSFSDGKLPPEKDDYLVQPCYGNHPLLTGLTPSDEAITVRLISENESLYFAWLEIPVCKRNQGERQVYAILPIDLVTGEVLHYPEGGLLPEENMIYQEVYDKLDGLRIPFWRELVSCASEGQKLFPDVYAIAWDFIVTEKGPVLLEGNSGWGATDEQILLGGLLNPNNPLGRSL